MMATLAWVLTATLGISFCCSILEAVLLSVNPSYVGVLKERDPRAASWMESMQQQIDEPIAAILTLNTIAHTAGATVAGGLARQVFGSVWIGLFSAALTLAVLLFSEIVPKTLGATFWQPLSRPATYVLKLMIVGLKPVLVLLSVFTRLISARGAQQATITRAELEILAEIGRREGTIDEAEWRVVSNVMKLDEVSVGEVMTPRTDMVAVSVNESVAEAKRLMLDEGHLRLPVYEDSLDQIVGILIARDLWRADHEGGPDLREIMRPAHYAPASKPVEDLIPEMRRLRNKMVIVVDEFGGTAGLVTLEDLIEEIIGEIQDEHEGDEPKDFAKLEDGRWRVWGGVPVREVNGRLGLALPEGVHDTIGGYLFGSLSRVGTVGDEVDVPEGRFRIAKMRGRRIEYAVFERPAEPAVKGA